LMPVPKALVFPLFMPASSLNGMHCCERLPHYGAKPHHIVANKPCLLRSKR
jgi:hypothetical protein